MKTGVRIYTRGEHGIAPHSINSHVTYVARQLKSRKYRAYVVGGAVRDLLCGIAPKDFDMVTNATPQQVRALFRNSRIIGRRFRLVHIYFGASIIEMSTFRATSAGNQYGKIEEDAVRRDFSANSLYYDPLNHWVIDYTNGVAHIHKRLLEPVIPLSYIFREDPVRMIRAIKYSQMANFHMRMPVQRAIKRSAGLLRTCPKSRLTEEMHKILLSSHARQIFQHLYRAKLLSIMQPMAAEALHDSATKSSFESMLTHLDRAIAQRATLEHALYHYLRFIIVPRQYPRYKAFQIAKDFLSPTTPPNVLIERVLRRMWAKTKVPPRA